MTDLSTASVSELKALGLKRIQTLVTIKLAHQLRVASAMKGITQREFVNSVLEEALKERGT